MRQPEKAMKLTSGVHVKTEAQELFDKKRGKGLRDIDPRMKLAISLSFSLTLFFTAQGTTILFSVLIAFSILLLSGEGKTSVKYLAVYAGCSLAVCLAPFIGWQGLSALFSIFIFTLMKFIPLAMLGSWLISTVKISELIAALEQMLLPTAVVIPLAVFFRFLPTVKEEFNYIRDTMKMRNIDLSVSGLLFHPVRTMEYILVPLLLRSVKVSDELSAAALARGLDGGKQRTSLREVRILATDAVIAVFFIAAAAMLWYFDQNMLAAGGRIWLCLS